MRMLLYWYPLVNDRVVSKDMVNRGVAVVGKVTCTSVDKDGKRQALVSWGQNTKPAWYDSKDLVLASDLNLQRAIELPPKKEGDLEEVEMCGQ